MGSMHRVGPVHIRRTIVTLLAFEIIIADNAAWVIGGVKFIIGLFLKMCECVVDLLFFECGKVIVFTQLTYYGFGDVGFALTLRLVGFKVGQYRIVFADFMRNPVQDAFKIAD